MSLDIWILGQAKRCFLKGHGWVLSEHEEL